MFVAGIKPVIFFLLTGRQGVQPWFPATWVLSNGCVYDSRSHCCSTLLLFPAHSVDGYKKLTFIFLFSLYFFFSSRFLTPWEEMKSIRALWNVVPAAVVNCDSEKQLSGKGWIKKWWMEFKGTQTHSSRWCVCVWSWLEVWCSQALRSHSVNLNKQVLKKNNRYKQIQVEDDQLWRSSFSSVVCRFEPSTQRLHRR